MDWMEKFQKQQEQIDNLKKELVELQQDKEKKPPTLKADIQVSESSLRNLRAKIASLSDNILTQPIYFVSFYLFFDFCFCSIITWKHYIAFKNWKLKNS